MAVKSNKKRTEAEKAAAAAEARTESRSQSSLRAEDIRQKALKSFHPSVVDWFKKNLGLDLASNQVPVSDLYKLGRGELTDPVKVIVTPLAYSVADKKPVEMPQIAAIVSLRASFPMEKGKPVALDDKHRIFLQTVPCRPLVELAGPDEQVPTPERSVADKRETKFTESQLMALEGIGISRERLYGGFNHLTRQEKLDILDGEIFPVEGNVKTDFGYVNVIGEARLRTDDGGVARVDFEPSYADKRAEGLVIDIDRARVIGTLELDFYKRTPDGKVKTDVSGAPVLNRAGENIMEFGAALEPVRGFLHKRARSEDGSWKDAVEVGYYNVKAVNGSLFAQKMNESEVLGPDGKKSVVYDIPNARIQDNAVFVSGQNKPLEFVSAADKESFIQGRGGMVKDASFKDFKTKKEVVYDAFVYAKENGFAEKFSPVTTEKIVQRLRSEKSTAQKATTRKKVRFGRGL